MARHLKKAEKLFKTFHQFEPVEIGQFKSGFRIPKRMNHVGEAKVMLYESDKLNPESGEDEGWISYFHDHEGDVTLCVNDREGDEMEIPKFIREVDALVRIGDCDGFEYEDLDGKRVKAKSKGRRPEWYAIPSGRALLVIQDKRKVLAILWGGSLDVQWRGVVG